MRSKKPPTAQNVCKRWDACGYRVPEEWQEKDSTTWTQAYADRRLRGNVKKLISSDKRTVLRRKP
jgi:hypothetical protein